MTGLDGLLQLPGQYISTVLDFLFRPGKFARTRNDDQSAYLNPYTFLLTNIGIAAGILASVAVVGPDRSASFTSLEATAIFLCPAVLHCFTALGCSHLTGWLLNESVESTDIVAAFCYSSVFYPLIGLVLALGDGWFELKPAASSLVAMTLLQTVAVAYLLPTVSRFSSLFGRRLLSFVSLATAFETFAVLVLSIAFAIVVVEAMREDKGERLHGHGFLHFNKKHMPMGSITLEAREVRPTSVQLLGASVGPTSREWFEIGLTTEMGSSVDSKRGVGTAINLTPETRYYFRYVVEGEDTTRSYGEIESFVTPSL